MRLHRFVTTGLVSMIAASLFVTSMAVGQARSESLKAGYEFQQKYASTLKGLSSTRLLVQPKLGNCEVTDFDLKEQGFRLDGGIGGLGLTSNPAVRPTVDATAQAAAYLHLADPLGAAPSQDVAIMVVDAFGSRPTTKLGDSVFERPTGTESGASVLTRLETSGAVSHGALVYAYVLSLVDHLPRTEFSGFVAPRGPEPQVLQQALFLHDDGNGHRNRILVQAVDTHDYDTSRIVTAIERGLHEAQALSFDSIAINMSFGIVPCSVKKDFKASGYDNIDTYLHALQERYGLTMKELVKLVFTPIRPDPLEARLSQTKWILHHVVGLASSGNDSLTYPYAPAAWPHVVAVGADAALTDRKELFSNTAGIRTGGAWYYVEDPISGRTTHAIAVAGTSFASPGAAVFTALDMMLASPRCDLPTTLYTLSRRLEDVPLDVAVDTWCLHR